MLDRLAFNSFYSYFAFFFILIFLNSEISKNMKKVDFFLHLVSEASAHTENESSYNSKITNSILIRFA